MQSGGAHAFRAGIRVFAAAVVAVFAQAPFAQAQAASADIIEQMKASPTGPFVGVRWFCNDGAILPPRPFACEERGGGRQHGLWSEQAEALRSAGLLIGNVLAATTPEQLAGSSDESLNLLTSVLVERFLIARDDGWIWRKARDFRGILQENDEREIAHAALHRMLSDAEGLSRRFLLVREAVRLLPGQAGAAQLYQIRGLSNAVADADPDFAPLRNRIHTHPTADNAEEVRAFAMRVMDAELLAQLKELADVIDAVYGAEDLGAALNRFADANPAAAASLLALAQDMATDAPASLTLDDAATALAELRGLMLGPASEDVRLDAMRLSLQLEALTFTTGRRLRQQADHVARGDWLEWVSINLRAMYGAGFLTTTEYRAAQEAVHTIRQPGLTVQVYRRELAQLDRVNHWCARRLSFFFAPTIDRWRPLEPLAGEYIPDRLRGSPVLLHAELMALLEADAQALAGVENRLFGEVAVTGVRALNPGVAQGLLARPQALGTLGRAGSIVIADETTADLPAVAGIVTAEAGNAVSHVQLLARNLGVPNVVVSGERLDDLRRRSGEAVFLAVSPGGVVRLEPATPATAALVKDNQAAAPEPLQPDLRRLDLNSTALLRLDWLRKVDSGRVVGPKAANLGELAARFPGKVSPGLAIPFARFRTILDLPFDGARGRPMIDWLRTQYGRIGAMPPSSERDALIAQTLSTVRDWLRTVPLPEDFVRELRDRMAAEFGQDGSYGVFVRSDTNIEDLPNFSGAGLNKTVPNVVGFENTLAAIRTVWASVFTERAWGWRQAMVPDPIDVYPAVLLHRSVAVDVSGVMLTADPGLEGDDVIHLAVNEGPGGGVAGQAAESLLLHRDGRWRLLSSATEPYRIVLEAEGGVSRVRAHGRELLLDGERRRQLLELDRAIAERCADLLTHDGRVLPADVEFGFVGGELVLFQLRPVVDDQRAQRNRYLAELDAPLANAAQQPVLLSAPPLRAQQP